MKDITHHEYWNEVSTIGQDIIDNALEYGSDVSDLTHEAIDGHEWIIYTFYHDQILSFTDNDEAYLDIYSNEDLGELVKEHGLDHARMVQAFYALDMDVRQWVQDTGKEKLEEKLKDLEEERADMEKRIQQKEILIESTRKNNPDMGKIIIERIEEKIEDFNLELEEIEEKIETLERVLSEV